MGSSPAVGIGISIARHQIKLRFAGFGSRTEPPSLPERGMQIPENHALSEKSRAGLDSGLIRGC